MADYLDFQLQKGKYNKAEEYTGTNAIVLAIRNILLSRPGNFPFNPSIGVNIRKYQFEILDDNTLEGIQNEIDRAIGESVPDTNMVETLVSRIDDNGISYLGISISAIIDGEETFANFLVSKLDSGDIEILNEIY